MKNIWLDDESMGRMKLLKWFREIHDPSEWFVFSIIFWMILFGRFGITRPEIDFVPKIKTFSMSKPIYPSLAYYTILFLSVFFMWNRTFSFYSINKTKWMQFTFLAFYFCSFSDVFDSEVEIIKIESIWRQLGRFLV